LTHLETRLAQAGCAPDPSTGAATPPIHLATTYEREADGSYPRGYVYSRAANPTRDRLEAALAALETDAPGATCVAFASGMAATDAVLRALRPGDHVVVPEDVYYGVRVLLRDVFAPWGLQWSAVDLSDLGALEAALQPNTWLVWAETPSNPLLRITDLAAVAERAHAAGALLAVDGTWTTPLLQRPLDLGADIVVHSLTKYLAGHSDVLGGAVVVKDGGSDFAGRIRSLQQSAGPVLDPFSAWLTLRGMRSLGARLRMQQETAGALAEWLAGHPAVARVNYPGLASHAGHAVAARQMSGFGAMLSFEVRGGEAEALAVAARCRVFTRATSLGGTESLIEHRASVESPPSTAPPGLLRVSVGLEHLGDLRGDLAQALGA
jgi:cystathionine gamma-synthase